jgi:prolipoprotein diacylglyceryltransferase
LIVMVTASRLLDRRPRPVGFFFRMFGVVYGGFRIWLDTLHQQPMRFYVLIGLAVGGLAIDVPPGQTSQAILS